MGPPVFRDQGPEGPYLMVDRCWGRGGAWCSSSALRFSRYPDNKDGRIAVLDTASIEEHVWSSCDLLRAELAHDENPDKYHSVSPFELYSKTRIRDLLRKTPLVFGEDPGTSAIELGTVRGAMDVAAFLQPRIGGQHPHVLGAAPQAGWRSRQGRGAVLRRLFRAFHSKSGGGSDPRKTSPFPRHSWPAQFQSWTRGSISALLSAQFSRR